jgi:hypothetical protein
MGRSSLFSMVIVIEKEMDWPKIFGEGSVISIVKAPTGETNTSARIMAPVTVVLISNFLLETPLLEAPFPRPALRYGIFTPPLSFPSRWYLKIFIFGIWPNCCLI